LHSFGGADGEYPVGGLILGTDGNLYGTTTFGGGSSSCGGGCGTLFKMTPGGTLTTIYSFQGFSDGQSPTGGVVQGTDGNFYGTSQLGGNTSTVRAAVERYSKSPRRESSRPCTHSAPAVMTAPTRFAGLTQATNGFFMGRPHQTGTAAMARSSVSRSASLPSSRRGPRRAGLAHGSTYWGQIWWAPRRSVLTYTGHVHRF